MESLLPTPAPTPHNLHSSTCALFWLVPPPPTRNADITAKNTSQFIFASLFGTAAGVSICAYIGQSPASALLCFGAMAGVSVYGAFK